MNTESKMIKQGPCPHCKSSDAYTVYDDGHGYCFSCESYEHAEGTDNIGVLIGDYSIQYDGSLRPERKTSVSIPKIGRTPNRKAY